MQNGTDKTFERISQHQNQILEVLSKVMGTEQSLADILISFLAFLSRIEGKTNEEITLSLTACGEYTLEPVGYLMTGIHNNATTVPHCDIVVTTARHEGRICLEPETDKFFVHQSGIQFLIWDGMATANIRKAYTGITYFDDSKNMFGEKNFSTSGNKLTLRLTANPKNTPLFPTLNVLRLKLYDISSRNRTVYTDGDYCDSTYVLHDSWVNFLPAIPGTNIGSLTNGARPCGFILSKDPPNSPRRICIVFLPVPGVNCRDINEKLLFNENYAIAGPEKTLTCDEVKKLEPYHVHCARASLKHYHMIVVNEKNPRKVNWFKLVVLDSENDENAIKKYVKGCNVTLEDRLTFTTDLSNVVDNIWIYTTVLKDKCQIGNYRIYDELISVHINGADEKYCSINSTDCNSYAGNCYCLYSRRIGQVLKVKAKREPTEKNITMKIYIPHYPPKEFFVGTISKEPMETSTMTEAMKSDTESSSMTEAMKSDTEINPALNTKETNPALNTKEINPELNTKEINPALNTKEINPALNTKESHSTTEAMKSESDVQLMMIIPISVAVFLLGCIGGYELYRYRKKQKRQQEQEPSIDDKSPPQTKSYKTEMESRQSRRPWFRGISQITSADSTESDGAYNLLTLIPNAFAWYFSGESASATPKGRSTTLYSTNTTGSNKKESSVEEKPINWNLN